MASQGRRFRRRKKEHIFVEGYYIDHANDVTPGLDKQEETFHMYGEESPELDVQHNFGTLQITVLDKFTNNAILDLCTNNDPGLATARQYRVQDLESVNMWANIKNQADTAYVKSYWVPGWTPGLPVPSGDPNAKASVQLMGNSGLPQFFEALWIKSKKIASGATGNTGDTHVAQPKDPTLYAIGIKAVNDANPFEVTDVAVTAAMVSQAGLVTFAPIVTAVGTAIAAITHVMVYYLQSGTGIYPAAAQTPGKLRT